MNELLKLLGFTTPTWNILGHTDLELHFNGHFIAYDGVKFHFIKTNPDRCYSGICFDDVKHKKMRKSILVCKALNEIRKTNWGIVGYEMPIMRMLLSMYFSNKQNTSNCNIDSSGNQARVAEDYIKKIRHGEWWETK